MAPTVKIVFQFLRSIYRLLEDNLDKAVPNVFSLTKVIQPQAHLPTEKSVSH